MNSKIIFGIDGGGTHSRLILKDGTGKVLARSDAGSTNIYSISKDEVFANISILIESALNTAGIKGGDLKAGCFAGAGLGRQGEQDLFREYIKTLLCSNIPIKVCTDAEALLCGGLNGLEGYCLIAGTGSVAMGRSADGRLVRAGGHGYMLGDEGSAAWMGRTAIARILRSLEGRDLSSNMLAMLLEKTGLNEAGDFIRYVHHDADKAKIAELAPIIGSSAASGDALALDILRRGAEELLLLVKSVIEQSPWIKNKELILAGGVLDNNKIFAEKLQNILAKTIPDLLVSGPKGTALEGACLLAENELL
ncbi:MAG: hypothetical protein FWG77_01070 [Treponema sp.]|nr:hypothetical protein [Treponema sp.]